MPWRLQVTIKQLQNLGPRFDVLFNHKHLPKESGIGDGQAVARFYKGEHNKSSSVAGQAFSKQPEATCCVRD